MDFALHLQCGCANLHCVCMNIFVFDSSGSGPLIHRLHGLGVHCQMFSMESVRDLGPGTEEGVYFVSHEALTQPVWLNLRARFGQANRYYVVAGRKLASGQIVGAARDGAQDVVDLEDDDERWLVAIERVVASQRLWVQLYGGVKLDEADLLTGQSVVIKALRETIEKLGPTGASVLILGESGVGKERVAQALHKSSHVTGPFIAVNCAAIPRDLIEAEIFGAEKGAYTGATHARAGLVEQADGGTLFLDEIGELDLGLQPKLLRFLETRKARRVGGRGEYRVEVRVLSATNSNLETEVARGKFRPDLFYRISEVTLRVPPLRSRLEDIPLFVKAFLQTAGERFGRHFESAEPELIRKFQQFEWPGNARELKNTIDRLVILYQGPVLRANWWEAPPKLESPQTVTANPAENPSVPAPQPVEIALASRRQKLEMAKKLLRENDDNLTLVSAKLGINPSTLYRWRKAGKV